MKCVMDVECVMRVIHECRFDKWIKDDVILDRLLMECALKCFNK